MRKPCAILALVAMLFGGIPIARADDHLVSRGAVSDRLAGAAAERARNLASLGEVLGTARAGKAAAIAGVDIDHVRKGLPRLSDSDLRDLSRRAGALKADPLAGHYRDYHSAEHLLVTLIVVSAIALVAIEIANS